MAGIGPATSPLPRECSTTEPHGQNLSPSRNNVERETGIEPASLAWKAKVLPLNYSRIGPFAQSSQLQVTQAPHNLAGGGGWIRTSVGVSQQIYSLPPLATRAPLRRTQDYSRLSAVSPSLARLEPPARALKPSRKPSPRPRRAQPASHGRVKSERTPRMAQARDLPTRARDGWT